MAAPPPSKAHADSREASVLVMAPPAANDTGSESPFGSAIRFWRDLGQVGKPWEFRPTPGRRALRRRQRITESEAVLVVAQDDRAAGGLAGSVHRQALW